MADCHHCDYYDCEKISIVVLIVLIVLVVLIVLIFLLTRMMTISLGGTGVAGGPSVNKFYQVSLPPLTLSSYPQLLIIVLVVVINNIHI